MSRREVADRIASRYPFRSLREYARWKIRSDPAYAGVLELLRGRGNPVADIGCGIGLLGQVLRENGFEQPYSGLDFDERKIAAARLAAAGLNGMTFARADARSAIPPGRDIVMLDILQYFDAGDRARILANAAGAVPPGGIVIVRTGIRDSSWRYRLTFVVDYAARIFRWMRAERLHFPAREEIVSVFDGFDAEVVPFHGRLPFNNYLFVFRRRPPEGVIPRCAGQ